MSVMVVEMVALAHQTPPTMLVAVAALVVMLVTVVLVAVLLLPGPLVPVAGVVVVARLQAPIRLAQAAVLAFMVKAVMAQAALMEPTEVRAQAAPGVKAVRQALVLKLDHPQAVGLAAVVVRLMAAATNLVMGVLVPLELSGPVTLARSRQLA